VIEVRKIGAVSVQACLHRCVTPLTPVQPPAWRVAMR
jgi:hypothetical protein